MNSKELRIGNLVEYGGEVVNVTGITEENPFVNTITPDYLDYEEITPIPITEEWLVKFEFEKPAHVWIGNKFWMISLGTDDRDITLWHCGLNKNNGCLCVIKYVHQLQNFYFALTNEELKQLYGAEKNKHDID